MLSFIDGVLIISNDFKLHTGVIELRNLRSIIVSLGKIVEMFNKH